MRLEGRRVDACGLVGGPTWRARAARSAPVHSDQEVRPWVADVALLTKEVWVVEGDAVLASLVLGGQRVDEL